jgi:hypothetical protein
MHHELEPDNGMPSTSEATDNSNNIVIKMERHVTGGSSPGYSLAITRDGKVIYEGIKNVNIIGSQTSHISESALNKLINEFINIYYFALKDKYGESNISDAPCVTTSISLDGKNKKIFHCPGSSAQQGLSALEGKIDEVTNSYQWTGL